MKQNLLIQSIEAEQLKTSVPQFHIGDTLSIHTRIVEGEKERVQVFTGTVISRKGGNSLSATFSVYRVSYGSGMEKVFMTHSPRIVKIEILKNGQVRKSKLYYLRGVSGKKAKVKERMRPRTKVNAKAVSAPVDIQQ